MTVMIVPFIVVGSAIAGALVASIALYSTDSSRSRAAWHERQFEDHYVRRSQWRSEAYGGLPAQ